MFAATVYGVNLDCDTFNYDGGDCDSAQCCDGLQDEVDDLKARVAVLEVSLVHGKSYPQPLLSFVFRQHLLP